MANCLELIEAHPWNNFLQLKSMSIFEEFLQDGSNSAQSKLQFIKESNMVSMIVRIADEVDF